MNTILRYAVLPTLERRLNQNSDRLYDFAFKEADIGVWGGSLILEQITVLPRLGTIDPADPPTFESQATYLRRLDLLLPGESERLTAADSEPELIEADPEAA